MDNHIILVVKTPPIENSFQDLELEEVSIIYGTPIRITVKGPVNITAKPRVSSIIITALGPIPYSSDKVIPWNYGADVYYHGVKQEPLTVESEGIEVTDSNVDNIYGTSKVTRRRNVSSPEISPKTTATPVRVTIIESTTETQ